MKAKDLIKILEKYPNYDVRLMYADCSEVSFDNPYPKYTELRIDGVDSMITTKTLETIYIGYEEM